MKEGNNSNRLSRRAGLRYRLLRCLGRGMALLPLKLLDCTLVPAAYALLYHIVRYRRGVVEENVLRAFPGLPPEERRRMVRRFYRHLSRLLLHQPRYGWGTDRQVKSLFRLENDALLSQLRDRGHRQVILLLGHVGPWELMGSSALHLDRSRYEVHVVYKRLHDSVTDRLMHEMRERHYARCVEMTQLPRMLLRHRDGEADRKMHLYCLLADQSPDVNQVHYVADFLGRDTLFISGWSRLAAGMQVPVVFYRIDYDAARRQWVGRFDLMSERPSPADRYPLVDDYVKRLEENILAAPHCWLWSHKRWRLRPEDFAGLVCSPRCSVKK